jgi:glycosyltransferase involved in cell wall biosynthesis
MITDVFAIGPFPPPVHGVSNVMLRAVELLRAAGYGITQCNVGARPGSNGVAYHAHRAIAYARCLIRLMGRSRDTVVYLALSGGSGLIYDFAVVAVARLRGKSIVFHHHSFAYIVRRSRLLNAIALISPKDHLHIALCSKMMTGLREQYGEHLRCCSISNLAFFDDEPERRNDVSRSFSVIGYLSNISFEKGIDRFLDFMTEMRRRGSNVIGRVAGPFANAEVQNYVEKRMIEIGGIEYLGPVYEAEKNNFLSSIDLLIFPSRYTNEAQPMVIYEAQLAAVPTASTDRGCISEMIFSSAGMLLDPLANNLEGLVDQALRWERDTDSFRAATSAAVEIRENLLRLGKRDREIFLRIFDRGEIKISSHASLGALNA